MLKSITLENFKSFGAKQTLELLPLNVLIGPNDAGKSNLLEAIRWLQKPHKADTRAIWDGAEKPSLTIDAEYFFPKELGGLRHRLLVDGTLERLDRVKEHIESVYPEAGEGDESIGRIWLRAALQQVYFYDTLEADDDDLAERLYSYGHTPEIKRERLEALRIINKNIEDVSVSFDDDGNPDVVITLSGNDFPLSQCSDGLRSWLYLIALLCTPSLPRLLCIEHPECGLHPDVLPKLAELLKAASERTQVIVTTHSETLLDALSDVPESVVVVEKGEQGTTLTRLDGEKMQPWLEKYRLGDLWMRGQLGGTRW